MGGAHVSLFREEVLESLRDRLHGQIVLTQPVSTRILSAAFFLIIAAVAVWITLGSYARVETVPGILITDIPSAKVVAPQNGVVTDLLVVEGQKVEKGDRLLVINSDRQAASGGNVVDRNLGVIAARRQLSEAQLALTGGRATAERGRLGAVISSAQQQAASLREQIALQEEIVASNQMIFDQISKVVERGFVSKVEYERRRQTLLNSRQSLASLQQQFTASAAAAQDAISACGRRHRDRSRHFADSGWLANPIGRGSAATGRAELRRDSSDRRPGYCAGDRTGPIRCAGETAADDRA